MTKKQKSSRKRMTNRNRGWTKKVDSNTTLRKRDFNKGYKGPNQ